MAFLQNQNETLGFSQTEVTQWESTLHPSSAVNNTIILLGVLTFALQLCLVLFVMLRCWRLDRRIQEALKHRDAGSKHTVPSFLPRDLYIEATYQPRFEDAASSPASSAYFEQDQSTTNFLFGFSVPWDLVQG